MFLQSDCKWGTTKGSRAKVGDIRRQQQHKYLYWEFYEGRSAQAVRMGDWKAVVKPLHGTKVELYHLGSDVGEKKDVASEHPDVVARARAAIKAAHRPSPLWKVRRRAARKKPAKGKQRNE